MGMREIGFEEMKKLEYKLLCDFDAVCKQEHFRYSLGGGTLLGAIRHKGFIPWDDDVDVMMPRPDYDQFIAFCNAQKDLPFHLVSYEHTPNYYNLFAKAELPNTVLDNGTKNKVYGLNIDIFPLDGLGDSYEDAKKRFRKTTFLREVLNASTWKKYSRSKTHALYIEPIRLFFFLISRMVNPQKIMKRIDVVNRGKKFDEMKYAACVCGSYREKEIMPQNELSELTEMQFEDRTFSCIKHYDGYLTQHYGDYMKLPPKEKQVTHHSFKVYIEE